MNNISTLIVSALLIVSGIVSVVAFVSWFSFGVESVRILYLSLPILIITLPLVLRRKAYFNFLLVWFLGPILVGLLVMSVKAIDTFLF